MYYISFLRRWFMFMLLIPMFPLYSLSDGAELPLASSDPIFSRTVQVTLLPLEDEILVGQLSRWYLHIETDEVWTELRLRSGSPDLWHLPESTLSFHDISGSFSTELSVIPLRPGELLPNLSLTYELSPGMSEERLLVQSANKITVTPVETAIRAELRSQQATVAVGRWTDLELRIQNTTPFTLTQMQFRDLGADVRWHLPPEAGDIGPGETFYTEFRLLVTGPQPRPQLRVDYSWLDDTDSLCDASLYVLEDGMSTYPRFLDRIPLDLFAIFLGVITSALTTLATTRIREKIERENKRYDYRQRVSGLLRLSALRALNAAQGGVAIDLSPLEAVFAEQGLFEAMETLGLSIPASNLWKAADEYNSKLELSGGGPRATEVIHRAKELRDLLESIPSSD